MHVCDGWKDHCVRVVEWYEVTYKHVLGESSAKYSWNLLKKEYGKSEIGKTEKHNFVSDEGKGVEELPKLEDLKEELKKEPGGRWREDANQVSIWKQRNWKWRRHEWRRWNSMQ